MNCLLYKPDESGFILLIAVITLVHLKNQNYPKQKITDYRPNHPFINPEHLGKPLIEHIECLQRGHQRKISRKISMVF